VTHKFGVLYLRICEFVKVAFLAALLASLGLLLPSANLHAQVQAGISGTVADSTGAVIPGAKVTIINTSTGVVSDTTTTSIGAFTVVGLLPGTYSVAADSRGFKNVKSQVTVEVASMSTINFTLQPGSMGETVNVKETAISLDTTSPSIGTTLEPELVQDAPIEISGMARQIDSFMYLAPGVEGSASYHFIDGGVTYENEVQFNGVPVAFVQFQGNQTNVNPPYEAVNEFRVNSSTFDSQYGLGQGAVTFNMASGTNSLHGDGFEILRNQLFDSDGFFPTRFGANGKPLPPIDQQNNYGFTVGGPVLLPRIYNGKNRTFFHFSSDWFRQNQALSQLGTVPTAAMKTGDFTNFVNASGQQIPIYYPNDPARFGADAGQPIPGNKIPPGQISPLSSGLLQSIPSPDRAGLNFGLQQNKSPAVSSFAISQFLWDYTVDETLTSSQSIHFSQWRDRVSSPTFTSASIVPSTNPLQSEYSNTNLGSGYVLNYNKNIRTNLVVTAGADWIGNVIGQHNEDNTVSFGAVAGGTTFPLVNFDGQNVPSSWGVNEGAYLECCAGGMTVINNRMLGLVGVNNWMWSKGRHAFNFGFQIRRTYQDTIDCNFCSGTFNFSQRTTSTPDSSDPNFGTYGSSFASFLLGEVDATERIFANNIKLRNKAFATYAQDQFKLTKNLTINLGLRWDILVPFTEEHNDIVFVDRTAPDPGAGGIPGAATKFGTCTGCSGITRAAIHWKNFQPRVGLSYQLRTYP